MSEQSFVFYKQRGTENDVRAMLRNAGVTAHYLIPTGDWTTIIPELTPDDYSSLIKANTGLLACYCFDEDYGWFFALYDDTVSICECSISWNGSVTVTMSERFISTLASRLPFLRSQVDSLRSLLSTKARNTPAAARRAAGSFARLMQFPYYSWLAYRADPNEYPSKIDRKLLRFFDSSHNPKPARPTKSLPLDFVCHTWIPANVFGSSAKVASRYERIVSNAWKSGSWTSALRNVERMDVATIDIVCLTPELHSRFSSKQMWRLHPPITALLNIYKKQMDTDGECRAAARIAELVVSGTDMYWFTIALLGNLKEIVQLIRAQHRKAEAKIILYKILDRAITWLPGIAANRNKLVPEAHWVLPDVKDPCWMGGIAMLLTACGWNCRLALGFETTYEDALSAFVASGGIRLHKGRPVLSPLPKSK